ncbi:hypothetical protein GYMLUDRAFT_245699 [Collybiopsis luxurians FD-317 M1]|uniref:Uncharacterized protein n=1 Tax=Collybiopsis luxurians FD-317 M1 TaxID=944289 RepID=A0A0D0C8X8_9AGAR|nr:hypothetical protein GYMLUDRAFT_245699 [Collybiopsis luxurians FD-317 M1]
MTSTTANALPNLLVFPEDHQLVGLSNWAVFCDHMKSVTQSTRLGGYPDGSITAPPPPNAPALNTAPDPPVVTPINSPTPSLEEWELHNGQLAGIVFQNIKDPCSIGVTQDMTSNEMWTKLTSEYEIMSAAAQTLAKECIQQFKYVSSTSFEDYFKQLEALHKAASDVGCTVTDNDLCSQFLTSLSTEHLWILQSHGARSYIDLKCALLEYDMMVESASMMSSDPTASNAPVVTSRSNSRIICNNCKHVGHI